MQANSNKYLILKAENLKRFEGYIQTKQEKYVSIDMFVASCYFLLAHCAVTLYVKELNSNNWLPLSLCSLNQLHKQHPPVLQATYRLMCGYYMMLLIEARLESELILQIVWL